MKSNLFTLIALSILALVCVPGCSESADTVAGGLVTRIAALEATSAQWNALIPRVQALENRPSGGSSFDASALNNKDNDLQGQINQLKTDRDNLKGQLDQLAIKVNNLTPGNSTVTSQTGTVQFVNNPVSIPQLFSSSTGGSSQPWIMTITNQSTVWYYVKPVINLNIASGQSQQTVSDITVIASGGACSITGSCMDGNPSGNFSFSPTNINNISTPSIVIIPISGCNGRGEIQIGPGQSQAINIQIQNIKTPNPCLWNISSSISSRTF